MSSTASFNVGQRPHIEVNLAGKPTRMLWDSGNDITLINHDTADRLGIPWRQLPDGFNVKGVDPTSSVPFKTLNLPIQIGGTNPITIPVGIGPIRDNLLGREGVLDRFDATISKNKVVFSQHGAVGNGLGLSVPIRSNQAYCTNGICCGTSCSNIF